VSDGAARVSIQFLGTDDRGIGAETILYADGDVTIQNNEGAGIVLNHEQVETLISFLVEHMALEVSQ
jgi:hypothetical protein